MLIYSNSVFSFVPIHHVYSKRSAKSLRKHLREVVNLRENIGLRLLEDTGYLYATIPSCLTECHFLADRSGVKWITHVYLVIDLITEKDLFPESSSLRIVQPKLSKTFAFLTDSGLLPEQLAF